MEKKKKQKLVIRESKYPDEQGKYILWLYSETKHGCNWRGLFKGSKKECFEKKLNLINSKEII